jgi:hypothetical protein
VAALPDGHGKTLAAALAAVLASLPGDGVHVVAIDDDLAATAHRAMAPLYDLLGVPHAVLVGQPPPPERRVAYAADVTYAGTFRLVLDALQDGIRRNRRPPMRRRAWAVVDDADVVLIDQARIDPRLGTGEGDDVRLTARLTVRSHLRSYARLGGLSGTHSMTAPAFATGYGLGFERVATAAVATVIHLHRTPESCLNACVAHVAERAAAGRRSLVVTPSHRATALADHLRGAAVDHAVLDLATADRDDARRVLGAAGAPGAVTVVIEHDPHADVGSAPSLSGVHVPLSGGELEVALVVFHTWPTSGRGDDRLRAYAAGRRPTGSFHVWTSSDAPISTARFLGISALLHAGGAITRRPAGRAVRWLLIAGVEGWWRLRPWNTQPVAFALDDVLDGQQATITALWDHLRAASDDRLDAIALGLVHAAAERLVATHLPAADEPTADGPGDDRDPADEPGDDGPGDDDGPAAGRAPATGDDGLDALAAALADVGVPPPASSTSSTSPPSSAWSAGPAGDRAALRAAVITAAADAYEGRRRSWPPDERATIAARAIGRAIRAGWSDHLSAQVGPYDEARLRLYRLGRAAIASGEAEVVGPYRRRADAAFSQVLADLPVAVLRCLLAAETPARNPPPPGGPGPERV